MRKKAKFIYLLVFVFCFSFLNLYAEEYVYPDDFKVGVPWLTMDYWYISLGEVIESLSYGDTLFIRKGIYPCTVSIPPGVTIEGEGTVSTILDGGRVYESNIFQSPMDNVVLRNLTLRNSSCAASQEFINSKIVNCLIMDIAGIGIYVNGMDPTSEISNCVFYRCEWGLDGEVLFENELIKNSIALDCYQGFRRISAVYYSCAWNCIGGGFDSIIPHNCIEADPRFVDPENLDFNLREDSPCRGTGDNGVDMGIYGGPFAKEEPNSCIRIEQDLGNLMIDMENDFRTVFDNLDFVIPGETVTEKFTNLIEAIIHLNKGRKEGICENLGYK